MVSANTKDTRKFIYIQGAKVHNLQNIDVTLAKNSLVVVTGLSGSGKSSLAFDTLYAEGQRRYVESLSAYVRQFLGKIEKPDVDSIDGLTPAIAIEQKVSNNNPRSTVGTVTEIYDYVKLLYARIGKTFSPVSHQQVRRDTPESILQQLLAFPIGSKCMLYTQVDGKDYASFSSFLESLISQGFSRIRWNDVWKNMEEVLTEDLKKQKKLEVELLIDRFSVSSDPEVQSRIYDSLQTAFFEGKGACFVEIIESKQILSFNNRFELDGISFEEPSAHFFSFNNPLGACKVCEGFGSVIGIDPDLVIPNPSLSVYEDAVVCWKGEKLGEWKEEFVKHAHKFDFPMHTPYKELSQEQKDILWHGNKHVGGIYAFFKMVEENTYKIQYRVLLSRYRGKTPCMDCGGSRLRKDASYVKIAQKSILQIVRMTCQEALDFFNSLSLDSYDQKVAQRLLLEIKQRLHYMCQVGLGYLSLDRSSGTLSGGESQRVHLATSLGSSLVGSTYILDEPSIGLHPRDGHRLIKVLESLRDIGNTVMVVEHDEDMMKKADQILDIGPMAGSQGGRLVFSGTYDQLIKCPESLTGKYLAGIEKIEIPVKRRKWSKYIDIQGVYENNLQHIDVKIPLEVLTVITGVSGSGKSTLIKQVVFPVLQKKMDGLDYGKGKYKKIEGDFTCMEGIEYVDQNPMGKTSRSNPVTYVKAFDEIRTLYSSMALSKMRGYKASHFSFNVEGGRCDQCAGDGTVTIEMQFMADVVLTCEACQGKRFREEILEVLFYGKSVTDVLEMTIDDAQQFFTASLEDKEYASQKNVIAKIIQKLEPLQKVGLGYLQMGQSSSTLSGGEAQRIKLASFLVKGNMADSKKLLFVFDEPSTGLHFHDIKKLLIAFDELIKQGHSIVLIEHHQDIIKCADWVIDLGPEAGKDGGKIVFAGTPEELIKHPSSYTGKFLKEKF